MVVVVSEYEKAENSSTFKENVVFDVLGAFLVVEDVRFDEERVARLGSRAYKTGLRANGARAAFLTMMNNTKTTFSATGYDWANEK